MAKGGLDCSLLVCPGPTTIVSGAGPLTPELLTEARIPRPLHKMVRLPFHLGTPPLNVSYEKARIILRNHHSHCLKEIIPFNAHVGPTHVTFLLRGPLLH